jgi:N utilization substance protein B
MSNTIQHANPNKNRTPRHRAREFALQGVYEWLLNNEAAGVIDAHIREAHGFEKSDREHFNAVLHGTINQSVQLREDFSGLTDRGISELSPIEHAVLLIGAYELKNHVEIPYRVVINEAVELAKSFGGVDGHRYVNGVLDKLAARLRPEEFAASKQ